MEFPQKKKAVEKMEGQIEHLRHEMAAIRTGRASIGLLEDIRVHIRNIRRDVLEEIKKAQKASQMTEDEAKKAHDELQKLTDSYITKVDETLRKKEAEITEI